MQFHAGGMIVAKDAVEDDQRNSPNYLEIQSDWGGADQHQHLSQQSFHLRFSDVLPVLLVNSP